MHAARRHRISRAPAARLLAALLLGGLGAGGAAAAPLDDRLPAFAAASSDPIRLADYATLEPGSTLDTYVVDGTDIEVEHYRVRPATINGVPAVKVSFAKGGTGYLTLDDAGLRFHRIEDRDRDLGKVRMTFTPPVAVVPALVTVGETYRSSGATRLAVPRYGSFRFRYDFTSRITGFEQVTVPLGTFDALRVEWRLDVSGTVQGEFVETTTSETMWLAGGVGVVKTVTVSDGEIVVAERIGATPALISPVPGGLLEQAANVFAWDLNGTPATAVRLRLGSKRGRANHFDSGRLDSGVSSAAVPALPMTGDTVHARLSVRLEGRWYHLDHRYTTANLPPPALIAPAPVLTASAATFRWTANGHAVEAWRLTAGKRRGKRHYHDSRVLGGGVLQHTVPALPAAGETVHVRLRYRLLGKWHRVDYAFDAARLDPPRLLLPAGPQVPGAHTRFAWTANGHAVDAWRLRIGKRRGARHYHDSGKLDGAATGTELEGLPTQGETVHVRLRYRLFGKWRNLDHAFEATE